MNLLFENFSMKKRKQNIEFWGAELRSFILSFSHIQFIFVFHNNNDTHFYLHKDTFFFVYTTFYFRILNEISLNFVIPIKNNK